MVRISFKIHDLVVNVDENKLYYSDRAASLEPKLINLLFFLAKNPNKVFSRDDIIDEVWNGAIVTDHVVTQSIFALRKLLKDGTQTSLKYFVTIPRRGYKLVAPVSFMTEHEFDEFLSDFNSVKELASKTTEQGEQIEPRTVDPAAAQDENITPFPSAPMSRIAHHSVNGDKSEPIFSDRFLYGILNSVLIGIAAFLFGYLSK